jgi:hypothetical protein
MDPGSSDVNGTIALAPLVVLRIASVAISKNLK